MPLAINQPICICCFLHKAEELFQCLVHSFPLTVCLSMENCGHVFFIPNVLRNPVLNFDVHNLFLSLTIYSRMPRFVNIFLKNNFINFSVIMVILHGINFVYLSIRRLSYKSCRKIFLLLGFVIPVI